MVIKVYGHPWSPCTRLALTVLNEKELDYEFHMVDLRKGEQKSAEHVARHPFGKVPAIEVTVFHFGFWRDVGHLG